MMTTRTLKKRRKIRRRKSPRDGTPIIINDEEVKADQKHIIKPRIPKKTTKKIEYDDINESSQKTNSNKYISNELKVTSNDAKNDYNFDAAIKGSEKDFKISKNPESSKKTESDLNDNHSDNERILEAEKEKQKSLNNKTSENNLANLVNYQNENTVKLELNKNNVNNLKDKIDINNSEELGSTANVLNEDITLKKEKEEILNNENPKNRLIKSKDLNNKALNNKNSLPSSGNYQNNNLVILDPENKFQTNLSNQEPKISTNLNINLQKERQLEIKRLKEQEEREKRELELIRQKEQLRLKSLNEQKKRLLELKKEEDIILKREKEILALKKKKKKEKDEKKRKKKEKLKKELIRSLKTEKEEKRKQEEKIIKMKRQLRMLLGRKKKVRVNLDPRLMQRRLRRRTANKNSGFNSNLKFTPRVRPKIYPIRSQKENKPPNKAYDKPIPDYDNMSIEEKARYRAEFAMKLNGLRTKWKNYRIPDYTNDDLKIQHAEYYSICDQLLRLVTNAQYKGFLLLIWAGIEIVGTKWIGIDISDFAKMQLNNFEMYDYLINEINSGSGLGIGRGFPPHVQIILLTLLNIVILLLFKWVSKYGGNSTVGIINNVVQGAISPQKTMVTPPGMENRVQSGPDPPSNIVETVAANVNNVANFFTRSKSNNGPAQKKTSHRRPRFND